jgi:phosphatidylcholine synthase
MMQQIKKMFHYLAGYSIHIFTASSACIALFTLIEIAAHHYIHAFWLMMVAVVIDALDGSFARLVGLRKLIPHIDGALLDNLVDFLNYVITPCFFLFMRPQMLPSGFALPILAAVTIASAYQFSQTDAKTPDHFFKGFPCYWNIVAFYLVVFNTSMWTNAGILIVLCALIFIPIKYVYPSRLDYLTQSKYLKVLLHGASCLFGVSLIFILLDYPKQQPIWLMISLLYVILYFALSFYKTAQAFWGNSKG